MELLGAAWATILARVVFVIPTFFIVIRRFGVFHRDSWEKPDFRTLRRIASLGWPTSVQLVVRIAAMLVTHSIVARAFTTDHDQSATTALGIVFRLETMALFVGLGWGSASQTFIGQNLGAGDRGRAAASGWYATAYNAAMMGALALLYRGFDAEIVGFFDPTKSVVEFASGYLQWVSPSYVALGVGIVLGSAMQGAGATLETLVIDAVVVGLVQVPASVIVVFGFDGGPIGLWRVIVVTYVAYAVAYVWRYRHGTYLKRHAAMISSHDLSRR
jgi:Na+-driven multidrug efflux pump